MNQTYSPDRLNLPDFAPPRKFGFSSARPRRRPDQRNTFRYHGGARARYNFDPAPSLTNRAYRIALGL